ncbi:hypothetical protein B0H19DRAFT_1080306 [Mycena capillaripes]|nr:hypothetical protein B0H19DRAFT_1080306 [Mycena capillaripes]
MESNQIIFRRARKVAAAAAILRARFAARCACKTSKSLGPTSTAGADFLVDEIVPNTFLKSGVRDQEEPEPDSDDEDEEDSDAEGGVEEEGKEEDDDEEEEDEEEDEEEEEDDGNLGPEDGENGDDSLTTQLGYDELVTAAEVGTGSTFLPHKSGPVVGVALQTLPSLVIAL